MQVKAKSNKQMRLKKNVYRIYFINSKMILRKAFSMLLLELKKEIMQFYKPKVVF